jgi:hypothetical protein
MFPPMNFRVSFTVACLALLPSTSFAQNAAAPDDHPQDVQTRAAALLNKARQLSDIRSPNAPAFRLKATFSFTGEDLEKVEGTYTEVWASNTQWRRETVIAGLRHIEVGGLDKQWLIEPDGFPLQANRLATLMVVLPPASQSFEFTSISESEMRDVTAECVMTKPLVADLRSTLCFEKKSNLLLEKMLPETRPRNVVMFSCEYGSFRKFGDYWFPHQVECFEDLHKSISADVIELSIETPLDPTLFKMPQGAIELGQCSGKIVSPTLPKPPFLPVGLRLEPQLRTRLWFVVDAKGRPKYLKVLPPSFKDSDQSVLNWVQHWTFSPGTCDGKPIPMQMTLDVPAVAQ